MSGYTPLFGTIVLSSIWGEDNATRVLWITMLALMNIDGVVESSVGGLAYAARLPEDTVKKSLQKLLSPDPDSRTKEDEGRRIREVEGGWFIINHEKFRKKAKSRAVYFRKYRLRKEFETTTGFTKQQFLDEGLRQGLSEIESEQCFNWTMGRLGTDKIKDLSSWITYWRNNQYKFEKKDERATTDRRDIEHTEPFIR